MLHSYELPAKLKTLLTATLSAASMKKRAGRPESHRERRARAYLALKNALWVSRLPSINRSIDSSIERDRHALILVWRRARARQSRRGAVLQERANVLLARSSEDGPSGAIPRRRAESLRSWRTRTSDERRRHSSHFKKRFTYLFSEADRQRRTRRDPTIVRREGGRRGQKKPQNINKDTLFFYLLFIFTLHYLK